VVEDVEEAGEPSFASLLAHEEAEIKALERKILLARKLEAAAPVRPVHTRAPSIGTIDRPQR